MVTKSAANHDGILERQYFPALKTAAIRGNLPLDWLLFLELACCPSPSVSGYFPCCLAFAAMLGGGELTSASAPTGSEVREARSLFPAKTRFRKKFRVIDRKVMPRPQHCPPGAPKTGVPVAVSWEPCWLDPRLPEVEEELVAVTVSPDTRGV